MDASQILHEPWLDRLLAESDPDKRLSLSLDACLALTLCPGVSLWKETSPNRFVCQRASGNTMHGPNEETIGMVSQGNWDSRQARHEIVVSGCEPHRMAWTLSLPLYREEALVSLEAFLFLVYTLHPFEEDLDGPSLLPSE